MTPATIRLARASDVDAVLACVTAAYAPYVERIGKPPAPMLDDFDELVTRGVVHVAVRSDLVVGVIVMWPNDDHSYIDNVASSPDILSREGPTVLVMLDLDNTLSDRVAAVRAWADEFIDEYGLPSGARDWILEQDQDGYADRRVVFSSIHSRFELPVPVDTLLTRYQRRVVELSVPTTGAVSCLRALRSAGHRTAIVTSGSSKQQHGAAGPTTRRRRPSRRRGRRRRASSDQEDASSS